MTKIIVIPPGTGLKMTLSELKGKTKLNIGQLHPLEVKNKPGTIPGCECNYGCTCPPPAPAQPNTKVKHNGKAQS